MDKSLPMEWAKVLLVPISLAILGYFFDARSKVRQDAESKDNLYVQLLSQRELSDSQLRTGMFKSVLDSVIKSTDNTDLDADVLKLEMLAYNFHESLDLGPLFKDLRRNLAKSKLPDDERGQLIDRLDNAARNIVDQQTLSLASQGQAWHVPVFPDAIDPARYVLDTGARVARSEQEHRPVPRVRLQVFDMNPKAKEMHVRLLVNSGSAADADVDQAFLVTAYDFPMMDNTRLADGSRIAVVIDDFNPSSARLGVVVFPALSAGLKDRVNFDEALREMLRSREVKSRAEADP